MNGKRARIVRWYQVERGSERSSEWIRWLVWLNAYVGLYNRLIFLSTASTTKIVSIGLRLEPSPSYVLLIVINRKINFQNVIRLKWKFHLNSNRKTTSAGDWWTRKPVIISFRKTDHANADRSFCRWIDIESPLPNSWNIFDTFRLIGSML